MIPGQPKPASSKGKLAELAACKYLQRHGLTLIETNFHSRFGEIDLIMKHQDTLVFIEVRFRHSNDYGGALQSITHKKQEKLKKTALYYMQCKGREFNARFDVVAITGEAGTSINRTSTGQSNTIEWIQNAF